MKDFYELREDLNCGEHLTIEEINIVLSNNIEEHELVKIIEKFLMTKNEKEKLFIDMCLNVYDILNGRYGSQSGEEKYAQELFNNWNIKLNNHFFGF